MTGEIEGGEFKNYAPRQRRGGESSFVAIGSTPGELSRLLFSFFSLSLFAFYPHCTVPVHVPRQYGVTLM